jgi:hypothetical protein
VSRQLKEFRDQGIQLNFQVTREIQGPFADDFPMPVKSIIFRQQASCLSDA